MPTLIIEHSGQQNRAVLNGRTSIGRTADNSVVIDHPAVSRIHAVIECVDGAYLIFDPGSKNGTMIGEELINQPRELNDGDRISIGPAILTFYLSDDSIDHSQAALSETHAGMLMDCECGAKLWVPRDMVGGRGQCQKCGRTITLGRVRQIDATRDLDPSEMSREQAAHAALHPPLKMGSRVFSYPDASKKTPDPFSSGAHPAVTRTCSICQWKIDPADTLHICPSCGLVFHSDCWTE